MYSFLQQLIHRKVQQDITCNHELCHRYTQDNMCQTHRDKGHTSARATHNKLMLYRKVYVCSHVWKQWTHIHSTYKKQDN